MKSKGPEYQKRLFLPDVLNHAEATARGVCDALEDKVLVGFLEKGSPSRFCALLTVEAGLHNHVGVAGVFC